jgi:hypothetical protein
MLFTYATKGNMQKSVYPINNRPPTNAYPASGPKNFKSGYAKPNPLKQWRKQLIPNNPVSSKQITIDQTMNPSVSVVTDEIANCNIIYTEVIKTTTCLGIQTENGCVGGTNNIRRSASTIISPKYSTSTRQYLQKRGKSFEQNYSIGKEKESPVYYSTMPSYDSKGEICKTVIYKPNNRIFKTQGAVSSAGYTAKVKQDYSDINTYNPGKKKEPECIFNRSSCNMHL